MPNRHFEHLSNRYSEAIKSTLELRTQPLSKDEFNSKVKNLVLNICSEIDNETATEEIEAALSTKKIRAVTKQWDQDRSELIGAYRTLTSHYDKLIDSEKSILRIERKAHTQALVFRFLTTVSIGFGIMIVYLVAQNMNIQMPLMKLPS